MEGHTESTTPSNSSWGPLFPLVGLVFLSWAALWLGAVYWFDKWADRGTFGDMFGAITSLYSGLAFAGVFYAVYLQRKELRATERALREQVQLAALSAAITAQAGIMSGSTPTTERSERAWDAIQGLQGQVERILDATNRG